MNAQARRLAAAVACWMALAMAQANPPAAVPGDAEVLRLLERVAASPCRFQRNGQWHAAAAARDHLQAKYQAARRMGLAAGVEAFVAQVGSRSSASGQPYRVRCPGADEIDAAPWLRGLASGAG